MGVDQPGVRRVPTDLYEWNARKRRFYEVLTWLLICALLATFLTVCLTVGATVRN
jgi:uncharacterized membrane protein